MFSLLFCYSSIAWQCYCYHNDQSNNKTFITFAVYSCLCRADLDKRWAEKQRLEEDRRKENLDKLRKDMEKSGGETVVLSTGLKDKGDRSKTMMDEEDEEIEDDDDDYERFTDDEDAIDEDEDEDEEVSRFSF